MGITEVITAPRSPCQNAYVERVIGSIRRECLDHIVIFNERHVRGVLSSYVDYYHRTHTDLSLRKDYPDSRPIQPPRIGRVITIPQVCSLHHRYECLASLICPSTGSPMVALRPVPRRLRMSHRGPSISIRSRPFVVRIATRFIPVHQIVRCRFLQLLKLFPMEFPARTAEIYTI